MKGFGYFNQFEGLKALTEASANLPEIEDSLLTDEQEAETANVSVRSLGDDKYRPSKPKAMGSAGNKPAELSEVDLEKEPQLGGIGGGLGMKRNFSRHGLGESDLGMDMPDDGSMEEDVEGTEGTDGAIDPNAVPLEESLSDGETEDCEPMDLARERTSENIIQRNSVDRAKEMLDEMFGSSFGKKKIDHDYTQPKTTIDMNAFKVKRGW